MERNHNCDDLKLFRSYLLEKANVAQQELGTNLNNKKKLLLKVTYCRAMLLNRKLGGELQRITLQLYQNSPMHQSCESLVMPYPDLKFKRLVTRGKRNRGVPVSYSGDVQQHLQMLITQRDNFVKKSNASLFPKLLQDSAITGYKVMLKQGNLSGAKILE